MADITLKVSFDTGSEAVSLCREDLESLIKQVEKPTSKVKVGLAVDDKALKNFKDQLEGILASVTTDKGAPIKVDIKGIGEISAQATQVKKSLDGIKKSGSETSTAFNEAKKAINGYFKALSDVDKVAGHDISFDAGAGKWVSATKEFQYLADSLTEAEQRFNTFASAEARAALSTEQQASLVRIETDAYNKYGVAIEQKASKERRAAEATAAATEAEKKKREAYLQSGEAVSSQIKRLDTLIKQTEANLRNWEKAKNGKSSGSYRELEKECDALKQMRTELASAGKAYSNFDDRVGKHASTIHKLSTEIKDVGEDSKTLTSHIGGLIEKFGSWLTISQGVMFVIRSLKKMASSVIGLDTAMTELKKVTDETDAVYDRFLNNAAQRARDLGTTLNDVVIATADFVRLGHSMSDASDLADAAIVYKNVGDGIESISQASESIISTMQAFGVEAKNVMTIVDKFNKIGNEFPVSATGIGEALLNSASALAAANNTLDESIALITAGNQVIQDPARVGTALKTLSMYIRAAKTEAEEAGIATDGMANSVSELRAELLDLTGQRVDIMMPDGETFKSTYNIIKELSDVWGTLSETTQANITELIGGGVRNSNVVNAIMTGFSTAEKVVASAANSAGSALAENEKYLESIQGRLDKFQASWQSLSANIIDSDWIKISVSGVTALINGLNWLIDASNGLAIALAAIPITKVIGKFEAVQQVVGAVKEGFTSFVGGAKRCPYEYAHYIVTVTLNESEYSGKAIYSKWLGALAPVNGACKKRTPIE